MMGGARKKIMDTMERIAVKSRDIAIVGYEIATLTLEIAFRRGGVYHYSGVPVEIYQGLLSASSQGKYFEDRIKHKFPYQKIS